MGVDISSLIESKEIEIVELSGREIAVDAFNTIYQFLSIIRDRMTGEPLMDSNGHVTSHLSGILYRVSKFMEAGIKPVFVYDGKPPELKKSTIAFRMEKKKNAEKKWKEAVASGKPAMTYAQAASRLTEDMINSSKKLLDCMGIPWVQAPSEGEMQCAHMCRGGKVWASGSQDFDSLLAGSPRLVRNLSITGKRKVPRKDMYIQVKPELIVLDDMLGKLGVTKEQLIIMGILIGTDYSEGVKGVGPKTALKLVKEHGTLDKVLENVEWDSDASAEEIYDFFTHPPVTDDYDMEWKEPDGDRLKEFMVEEHDFSSDRVDKVLERLQSYWKKGRQSNLSGWFGK